MCINTKCSEFDLDGFENCSGLGIRSDGNACNVAVVISENNPEWDAWVKKQDIAINLPSEESAVATDTKATCNICEIRKNHSLDNYCGKCGRPLSR